MTRSAAQTVPSPVRRWGSLHWLLGGIWTLLVIASLGWNIHIQYENTLQFAINYGRLAFEKDVLYRRWNAGVGPVYVRMDDDTLPNPHLEGIPDRDIMTPSGVPLTLVNPAYMTRMVHELGETASGVRSRLTSPRPLREQNAPDPWELQAFKQLEGGVGEVAELQVLDDGQTYMRLIRPLRTEQACLRCHGKHGYREGDIRGGISIAVPMKLAEQEFHSDYGLMGLGHLLLWLAGALGFGTLGRRIAGHIRDQARAEQRLLGEKQEQARLIEQLRTTQAQLVQAEKMASIGQLAAGVAHEINNPVGYISSNLRSLQAYLADMRRVTDAYAGMETALPDNSTALGELRDLKRQLDFDYLRDDAKALLEESLSGADRVKRIIQDLKNFARSDQEAWQTADLEAVLDSTLNIVWNELKYKAQVDKAYGGIPPVTCMPGKMSQVFMNLLVNAAQAIEDKGRIAIRTGPADNGRVYIEIEDNGGGIAPRDLPHLFEPFFTTKPQGKGTGLGLSISFGIVQSHGGDIQVRSEPGRGSCFRVTLPIEGGERKTA